MGLLRGPGLGGTGAGAGWGSLFPYLCRPEVQALTLKQPLQCCYHGRYTVHSTQYWKEVVLTLHGAIEDVLAFLYQL